MNWTAYNEHDELVRAMSQIETLEHNLRVEQADRDRFYRELIECKVIIASLERRLKECEARQ